MNRSSVIRSLTFGMQLLMLAGCSDGLMMFEKVFNKNLSADGDMYVPVPGDSATGYLSRKLANEEVATVSSLDALDSAITEQAQVNLVSLGLLAGDSETAVSVSQTALGVLEGGEKSKSALNPDTFEKIDLGSFKSSATTNLVDYTSDAVDWGGHTDTRFTIPALDRMPVRDQGLRGTCASFAGVGLIEAFVIQNSPSDLPYKEIDLSEQRFYYLSKPDIWGSGGSVSSQGSDSGSGFMSSNGQISGHPAPSDTGGSDYNLPLESSCPYVKTPGSNDLQIPLAAGCKTGGVIKVSQFTAWGGSLGTTNRIEHAQDIYREVRSNKAVIVYSKLSANWERNDGIITYKGAGSPGATGHAGGHAYLVVGVRKLSESEFPGEGGMCFIIRNSWGKGWGVNGLSCMTLTWFDQWRLAGTFPTVDQVQLVSDAKQKITIVNNSPSAASEPIDSTRQNQRGGTIRRRKGVVTISRLSGSSPLAVLFPWSSAGYGEAAMKEIDVGRLVASDMNYGTLVTENDQSYKIFYTASATQVVVRGILDGDAQQTHSLELARSGSALVLNVEGRGEVTVGEITEAVNPTDASAGQVVLCGKAYASVCDLNYVAESNELVIGLSELEAKREIPQPPYNWRTLAIAGYGFEISKPDSALTKFDIRLLNGSNASEPQRMKLDPTSGSISHKGKLVGNLASGSLCSGDHRDSCRVVRSDNKFEILPKVARN